MAAVRAEAGYGRIIRPFPCQFDLALDPLAQLCVLCVCTAIPCPRPAAASAEAEVYLSCISLIAQAEEREKGMGRERCDDWTLRPRRTPSLPAYPTLAANST